MFPEAICQLNHITTMNYNYLSQLRNEKNTFQYVPTSVFSQRFFAPEAERASSVAVELHIFFFPKQSCSTH